MNKKRRQQVILELVAAQPVASQEELRQLLDDRGFAVTQSTLSRDLRELRLARIPTPKGARYASPEHLGDDHRTALEDVFPQFYASSDGVVASASGIECCSIVASDSPTRVRNRVAIWLSAPRTSSFRGACACSSARMSPVVHAVARSPRTY